MSVNKNNLKVEYLTSKTGLPKNGISFTIPEDTQFILYGIKYNTTKSPAAPVNNNFIGAEFDGIATPDLSVYLRSSTSYDLTKNGNTYTYKWANNYDTQGLLWVAIIR